MKALIFQSKNNSLDLTETARPIPQAGEVLIKMHYAALNHLDLWIWEEQELDNPVVSGSDGSGVVIEAGPGADASLIGKEVIINPSLFWGDDEKSYSERYEVLGNPTNGTFAEYMVIPAEYVFEKPAHLTMEEAAALPMAALTAYRALFTKAQLKANEKLLITGIGGGVALYLLQMAVAAGTTVYVTSSSTEKIKKAIGLGAAGGFNYKEAGWAGDAINETGGFNVIVDSAGGDGFVSLTEVAAPGGRVVVLGRTAGNINNLRPGLIFNKQLQILGSLMGAATEFRAMLDFYSKHQLHPEIDRLFSFDEIGAAVDYVKKSNQFGKIVLKII